MRSQSFAKLIARLNRRDIKRIEQSQTNTLLILGVRLTRMIDKLKTIAQAIKILKVPSIAVGLIGLASFVVIIFSSSSYEDDLFLIPSIVIVLWAMSTYTFITTFSSIPEKPNKSFKIVAKLKRNIYRGWYWFIGIVFLGTTLATIVLSYRMVSIWIKDYYG
jgi:hypothetical protein